MSKTLISTDKNGTKIWGHRERCGKCGGTGYIGIYHFNQAGLCFDCWGCGFVEYTTKEYTEEYAAKLEARRIKREEKKRAELIAKSAEANQEFFEKQGFNSDGLTYVVLGNTYEIKEELKELGCKFSNLIGWHSPVKLDKYPTVEISVDDVYFKDYTETYKWNNWKNWDEESWSKKVDEANEELKKLNDHSEYIAEVGEKVELEVTYKRRNSYETQFGTTYIFHFEDESGNQIIWKTGTYKSIEENTKVSLKGTVKELNEYKGTKQTVLTRCKIS